MTRWPIIIAGALASVGCTTIPATDRSLALVQPVPPYPGEIRIYSDLCAVPGAMQAVSELEVANAGRSRSAIEDELAALARQSGADAIVLNPLNRSKLGVAYTSSDSDNFSSFRYSRATAIRLSSTRSGSPNRNLPMCAGG